MRWFLLLFGFISFTNYGQNTSFNVVVFDWLDEVDSLNLSSMEWEIDGQNLRLGGKPVILKPLNSVDTVFYWRDAASSVDTFICKSISSANYTFSYNTCCGGFDVYTTNVKKELHRNYGKINLSLINADSAKRYIFSVGESVKEIEGDDSVLVEPSQSPMQTNLYSISLEDSSVPRSFNELNLGDEVMVFESPASYLFKFNYMPLSEEILFITFDCRTGELKIK